MTALLTRLLELIFEIPPCAIIHPDEGGVLIRGGKFKRTLKNGFHWKLPLYDSVRKITITEQTIDLPIQTVGDMTASGYIKYRVIDPRKALLEVYDYDTSLPRQAMNEIASAITSVREMDREAVEEAVTESLDEYADAWGIEVLEFGLVELTKCRVYRLMQQAT